MDLAATIGPNPNSLTRTSAPARRQHKSLYAAVSRIAASPGDDGNSAIEPQSVGHFVCGRGGHGGTPSVVPGQCGGPVLASGQEMGKAFADHHAGGVWPS